MNKLITGGAEYHFCKLENQLKHPELMLYTAAGGGELYEQINITSREFGCLIPDYSVQRFCQHILAMKEEQQLRNEIARRTRSRIQQNFSLEKMGSRTMREYLSI